MLWTSAWSERQLPRYNRRGEIMLDVPDAVYVLWIIALVVVLLVVPIAVYYLHRLLTDGLRIKRYTAEMLAAGLGVAGNTQHIVALESTIQVATGILETAGAIDQ